VYDGYELGIKRLQRIFGQPQNKNEELLNANEKKEGRLDLPN
jgi:hypothetical protein